MQFDSSRADELSNRGRKTIDLKQQLTEVGANAFLKLAEAPIWVQAREVCENWKSKRERERHGRRRRIFLCYSSSWRQNQARGGGSREDTLSSFLKVTFAKMQQKSPKKTRLIFNQFFHTIKQTEENNNTRKTEHHPTRLKILKMASSSALTTCQNKKTNSWESTTLFAKILISTGCPNKF